MKLIDFFSEFQNECSLSGPSVRLLFSARPQGPELTWVTIPGFQSLSQLGDAQRKNVTLLSLLESWMRFEPKENMCFTDILGPSREFIVNLMIHETRFCAPECHLTATQAPSTGPSKWYRVPWSSVWQSITPVSTMLTIQVPGDDRQLELQIHPCPYPTASVTPNWSPEVRPTPGHENIWFINPESG